MRASRCDDREMMACRCTCADGSVRSRQRRRERSYADRWSRLRSDNFCRFGACIREELSNQESARGDMSLHRRIFQGGRLHRRHQGQSTFKRLPWP